MKKLPEIFQNYDIEVRNNKDYFYSSNKVSKSINNTDIKTKLEKIFDGISSPFNETVIITTRNKTYETNLIYKTKEYIVTIEDEEIPINSITTLIIKK